MRVHLLWFPIFFFNDTATTEIYTLSLHDALPISMPWTSGVAHGPARTSRRSCSSMFCSRETPVAGSSSNSDGRTKTGPSRSEEHTSELQSRQYLVCRLLLEKKKKNPSTISCPRAS